MSFSGSVGVMGANGTCAPEGKLEVLNKRWTMRILAELDLGNRRFNELSRALAVNPNTLSMRLKELEEIGLVHRIVLNELPPAVEYGVTASGKEAARLCRSLVAWSEA